MCCTSDGIPCFVLKRVLSASAVYICMAYVIVFWRRQNITLNTITSALSRKRVPNKSIMFSCCGWTQPTNLHTHLPTHRPTNPPTHPSTHRPTYAPAHLHTQLHSTQPNPTQPSPIQPNPTQSNPTQPNPTQPNPTQPNPTQSNPTLYALHLHK